ncbi:hypothetical protein [Pseudosulfitobacter sp. SM2401]|uniref:hypothetical protein n=1 Tax=Pseudosulfitobacter sp. SM2401 TaxID=3350098 RepID=UPI0036F3A0A3
MPQDQTNPKLYGDLIAKTVDDKINDVVVDLINRICEREAKVERFKARPPWLAGGFAILFVVGLLVLPRFIAAFPSGCAVLGGLWTTTTTGVDACVFYSS